MKLALVRHFRVITNFPKKMFLTPQELTQWFSEYESSDIQANTVNFEGIKWEKCFSSDLPRAAKTAGKIFPGEIIELKELREIQPVVPIMKEIKLPFVLYPLLLKAAWFFGHKSQPESKLDVEKRAKAVLDMILTKSRENILIVSHAGFMKVMRKELLNRGFKGPKFNNAENGKVYIYECLGKNFQH